MVSKTKDRLSLVRDLLACTDTVQEIAAQLAEMGWDYDGDGVALTGAHLVAILRRFEAGLLSGEEVETWANLVEGRDDVEFEQEHSEEIEDVLYELANPELTQTLDKARAKMLIEKVSWT